MTGPCFFRHLLAATLAFLWAFTFMAHAAPFPLPSGAVAWWRGEGDANDTLGGGNGVLRNGAAFANGKVGRAFSLDGINDFIEIPNTTGINFFGAMPMSFDLWAFMATDTYATELFGIRDGCEGFTQFKAAIIRNRPGFFFVNVGDLPDVITPFQWHHLAGTYDGSVVRAYVDGVLVTTQAVPIGDNVGDIDAPLTIGISGICGPDGAFFHGLIDEFTLYNRALTEAEIQGIYSAGEEGKIASGNCAAPTALTITTLAGLAGTSGSADGSGNGARFYVPQGVAFAPNGDVLVADGYNHTIRRIDAAGQVITIAGQAGIPGAADGIGVAARFNYPSGVVSAPDGTVFVTDSANNTIRRIAGDGTVTTIAGMVGQQGTADGVGSAARFYNPYGIARDAAGILYIADTYNGLIRKLTPDGTVTTLTQGAYGIAVTPDGTAFFTYRHTIRRFTPDGTLTTVSGLLNAPGYLDGAGGAARFSTPIGIAVTPAGNLLVADKDNQAIRLVTPNGDVTTVAGLPPGGPGSAIGSADGTGADARFHDPYSVAVRVDGRVAISDTFNHTIRLGTCSEAPPAHIPRIVAISVPVGSQSPESRTAQDNVWSVSIPPVPLNVDLGIGIIVNPTVVGGNNNTDFALHQDSTGGPYIASYSPDPTQGIVTYRFDQPVIVSGVEIVQHVNGITRVEGLLGASEATVTSLGSVFGPAGDVTDTVVAEEGETQRFDFGNSTVSGTVFQLIVRKTNHDSAFATYRIYPLDAAGNRIPAAGSTQQITPAITWNPPADIVVGTALGPDQLNAGANVPGTFSYDPPEGTILAVGGGQTLSVTFIPDDSVTYATATASVAINVLPADQCPVHPEFAALDAKVEMLKSTLESLAGTVASLLDIANSTRASQASVDALIGPSSVLAFKSDLADLARLDIAVSTRASQTSVDALGVAIAGLPLANLDVPVSSRSDKLDVAAIRTDIATLSGTLSGSLASQASLDALSTKLDQHESARAADADVALRAEIERHLADGTERVSLFYLPVAQGGHLEFVRDIVHDVITRNAALGLVPATPLANAHARYNNGLAALAAGQFKTAYDEFANAYRKVVK